MRRALVIAALLVAGLMPRIGGAQPWTTIDDGPPGLFRPLQTSQIGRLDSSFGTGGRQRTALNRGGLLADSVAALQLDRLGRVVVAGTVELAGDNTDFVVARYRSDGALDPDFSGDGVATYAFDLGAQHVDQARALAVDAQNRPIVAGTVQDAEGGWSAGIVRLDASGNPDPTFGDRGRVVLHWMGDRSGRQHSQIDDLRLDGRGRLVVAGSIELPNRSDGFVMRLLPDGKPDRSFALGNALLRFELFRGRQVVVDVDDSIYFVAKPIGTGAADVTVFRITEAGPWDTSFGVGAIRELRLRPSFAACAAELDAERRLVLAGTSGGQLGVVRLTAAGELDPSFGAYEETCCGRTGWNRVRVGKVAADLCGDMAIDRQGNVVVVGGAEVMPPTFDVDGPNRPSNFDFGVARFGPFGNPDTSFGDRSAIHFGGRTGTTTVGFDLAGNVVRNTTGAGEDSARAVGIDPFGRIYVAGAVEATSRLDLDFGLVRLHGEEHRVLVLPGFTRGVP